MKIFLLLIVMLLPLSSLAGDEGVYRVHAALALTGIGSSFGTVEVKGATLAVEEFNRSQTTAGIKAELVVEDTQSTNIQTLSAVRKLSSIDGAKIVIGPTWLDSYQSVLPLTEKEDLFLFTPSAAIAVFKKSAQQFPNVFSAGFNLGIQIDVLLDHIKRRGHRKLALIFDYVRFFTASPSLCRREPLRWESR